MLAMFPPAALMKDTIEAACPTRFSNYMQSVQYELSSSMVLNSCCKHLITLLTPNTNLDMLPITIVIGSSRSGTGN